MKAIVIAALVGLVSSPAMAGCIYSNASMTGSGGTKAVFTDYLHFKVDSVGAAYTCIGTDDRQPHGPYAVKCKADEGRAIDARSYNFFNSPPGGHGPTLLFNNDVWYARPGCKL